MATPTETQFILAMKIVLTAWSTEAALTHMVHNTTSLPTTTGINTTIATSLANAVKTTAIGKAVLENALAWKVRQLQKQEATQTAALTATKTQITAATVP
jgi:hypothetical protein